MAAKLGKDGLTVKQRLLVKSLAEGKTMTMAGKEAGYGKTTDSARVQAHKELQKPTVAAALEAALDRAGASLDASAKVIAEAHEATKLQSVGFKTHTVVDHKTRLSAAELNLRARKAVGPAAEAGAAPSVNLIALVQMVKQSAEERGLPL